MGDDGSNILTCSVKIPDGWSKAGVKEEDKKCRSKLIEERRLEKIPHPSYDLDGDGFVGGRDYVIAKQFDKDMDGKLNAKERANAIEAIKNVRKVYIASSSSSSSKGYLIDFSINIYLIIKFFLRDSSKILCGMWRSLEGLGLTGCYKREEYLWMRKTFYQSEGPTQSTQTLSKNLLSETKTNWTIIESLPISNYLILVDNITPY